MKNINVKDLVSKIPQLKAGERVLLSGTVYTARDAAHKRLAELIENGKALPFEMDGAVIYYSGPCPAKPGDIIGSCGPTTSARMDAYTPALLSKGAKAFIGKGPRSEEVREAIKESGAVYFAATGGVAALFSRLVRKAEVVAFPELGPEAVFKLEVIDFPLIVAIDSSGGDVFVRK
jgi:fumarate hydratase subunit beta